MATNVCGDFPNQASLPNVGFVYGSIVLSDNPATPQIKDPTTITVIGNSEINITVDPEVCLGETATLNATITDGESSCTIQWQYMLNDSDWVDFGSGNTTQDVPTNILSVEDTFQFRAIYDCAATDCGTFISDTVEVVVQALPEATVSSTNPTCGEDNGTITFTFPDNPDRTQIQFSIDGGNSYPYVIADNQGSLTVSGLAAGSYNLWVQWEDSTCPVDLPDVTLVDQAGPTATTAGDVICEGETATVSVSATGGTAPLTYAWSDGLGSTNTAMVTPTATTTYTVTITDSNGCTATDVVIVTVNPNPVAVALNNGVLTCDNTEVIIIGRPNNGPYSYSWTGPNGFTSGARTTSVSEPGIYTLTLTDTNTGCTDTATTEVVQNVAPPVISAGPILSMCEGDTGTLSPNIIEDTPPYMYSWTGPNGFTSDLESPSVTEAGIYTLEVTNGAGCGSVDDVVVNVFDCDAESNCYYLDEFNTDTYWGSDGSLNWSNVSWDENGDNNISTSGDVAVLGGVLMIENNDSTPPSIQREVDLSGHTSAVLSFDFWGAGDLDLDDAFIIEVFDGATWTTVFSFNGVITGTQTPYLDISAFISADSEIRISIVSGFEDSEERIFFDNVRIDVDCLCEGIADAGADEIICAEGSVQLAGSGGVEYEWSPAADLSDSQIADPIAAPTGTTTYLLTVTDEFGCTDTDEVTVTVRPEIGAVATADPDVICPGESTQLNASLLVGDGVTYAWSPSTDLSDATIANPIATLNVSRRYTVTITDANGCEAIADVAVRVHDEIDADVVVDVDDYCIDGSGTATVTIEEGEGPFTINWQNATGGEQGSTNLDDLGDVVIFGLNGNTTYCIEVLDANGCKID